MTLEEASRNGAQKRGFGTAGSRRGGIAVAFRLPGEGGRYLAADAAGSTEWAYPITRPDAPNTVTLHSAMTLEDASGNGAKKWSFVTAGSWQAGMVSDFRQLANAGSSNGITHDTYSW